MSSTWSTLTSSSSKKPKVRITKLSDEELRTRIIANATVLFPSPSPSSQHYEIVYATRPKTIADKQLSPTDPPWQYALLVRRNPSTGETFPLLRGQAWSSPTPWSMVLQGLLDTTSVAIHKKFAGVALSPTAVVQQISNVEAEGRNGRVVIGAVEGDAELPPYERSSSSLLLESGSVTNRLQRMNIEESRRLAGQAQ